MKKTNPPIILASTSPRRKELFAKLGIPFTIETSEYEEDMTLKLTPRKLALVLSRGKAAAVAKKHKVGIVIGADTFVVLGNHLLGKPKSEDEAKKMLRRQSGKSLDIITGFTIVDAGSGKMVQKTVVTTVLIKKLTSQEIDAYVASGEPMDKAGAFAIQGIGSVLIKHIEGDFLGAMGLPLYDLAIELKKFGVQVL